MLSYHSGNKIEFTQTLYEDGNCTIVETESHNLPYYIHGAFMWISWALIGALQIYTNRYWRAHWRWNKIVHAMLGFLALILVITSAFIAINIGGWTINS